MRLACLILLLCCACAHAPQQDATKPKPCSDSTLTPRACYGEYRCHVDEKRSCEMCECVTEVF
jgi:hypothetical protein